LKIFSAARGLAFHIYHQSVKILVFVITAHASFAVSYMGKINENFGCHHVFFSLKEGFESP